MGCTSLAIGESPGSKCPVDGPHHLEMVLTYFQGGELVKMATTIWKWEELIVHNIYCSLKWFNFSHHACNLFLLKMIIFDVFASQMNFLQEN